MRKIKSRKVWVMIVFTIFMVVLLIRSIPDFMDALPYYSGICGLFIGGNVAQKWILKGKG